MSGDDEVGAAGEFLDAPSGLVGVGRVEISPAVGPEIASHDGVPAHDDALAPALEPEAVVAACVAGGGQKIDSRRQRSDGGTRGAGSSPGWVPRPCAVCRTVRMISK